MFEHFISEYSKVNFNIRPSPNTYNSLGEVGQLRYDTLTQIGNEYVLSLSQQILHNTSSMTYAKPAAAKFSNHIANIQL